MRIKLKRRRQITIIDLKVINTTVLLKKKRHKETQTPRLHLNLAAEP